MFGKQLPRPLATLCRQLGDPDSASLRIAALESLPDAVSRTNLPPIDRESLIDRLAVPHLPGTLWDPHPEVVEAALTTLAILGPDSAVVADKIVERLEIPEFSFPAAVYGVSVDYLRLSPERMVALVELGVRYNHDHITYLGVNGLKGYDQLRGLDERSVIRLRNSLHDGIRSSSSALAYYCLDCARMLAQSVDREEWHRVVVEAYNEVGPESQVELRKLAHRLGSDPELIDSLQITLLFSDADSSSGFVSTDTVIYEYSDSDSQEAMLARMSLCRSLAQLAAREGAEILTESGFNSPFWGLSTGERIEVVADGLQLCRDRRKWVGFHNLLETELIGGEEADLLAMSDVLRRLEFKAQPLIPALENRIQGYLSEELHNELSGTIEVLRSSFVPERVGT